MDLHGVHVCESATDSPEQVVVVRVMLRDVVHLGRDPSQGNFVVDGDSVPCTIAVDVESGRYCPGPDTATPPYAKRPRPRNLRHLTVGVDRQFPGNDAKDSAGAAFEMRS